MRRELPPQKYGSICFPIEVLHDGGKKLDELKPRFNQEDVRDNVKDLFGLVSFISFAYESLIKKKENYEKRQTYRF